MPQLKGRRWHVQGAVAIKGEGLYEVGGRVRQGRGPWPARERVWPEGVGVWWDLAGGCGRKLWRGQPGPAEVLLCCMSLAALWLRAWAGEGGRVLSGAGGVWLLLLLLRRGWTGCPAR